LMLFDDVHATPGRSNIADCPLGVFLYCCHHCAPHVSHSSAHCDPLRVIQ